jgi:hypothetical protein
MQSKANTVRDYLASLPDDRRKAIEAVRQVILDNIDPAFQETMQYGMIGYSVPHSIYPAGYHCDPKQPLPFAGLASQKNHMALYLFCVYVDEGDAERFQAAWKKSGKKLDMGKSCVRFKKLEDVALDVIGDVVRRADVKRFIATYERARERWSSSSRKASSKAAAPKRKAAGKAAKQKTAAKASAATARAAAPRKKAARKKAARKTAAR